MNTKLALLMIVLSGCGFAEVTPEGPPKRPDASSPVTVDASTWTDAGVDAGVDAGGTTVSKNAIVVAHDEIDIMVTTAPEWQQSRSELAGYGHEASGGLNRTYDDESESYTLNWVLTKADGTRWHTPPVALGLSFDGRLWALAGRDIYSTYPVGASVGLVAFSHEDVTIDIGTARVWDSHTRTMSDVKIASSMSTCVDVLWDSPEFSGPVMTYGCITKGGEISQVHSHLFSLSDNGLPSREQIDAFEVRK